MPAEPQQTDRVGASVGARKLRKAEAGRKGGGAGQGRLDRPSAYTNRGTGASASVPPPSGSQPTAGGIGEEVHQLAGAVPRLHVMPEADGEEVVVGLVQRPGEAG